jgi:hypothetical protein
MECDDKELGYLPLSKWCWGRVRSKRGSSARLMGGTRCRAPAPVKNRANGGVADVTMAILLLGAARPLLRAARARWPCQIAKGRQWRNSCRRR